jgi:RNA polymerase subunit RPABC4/transcription elongation factor Spt4
MSAEDLEFCPNCGTEINLKKLTTYVECEICWLQVCNNCAQEAAGDNWEGYISGDPLNKHWRCAACPGYDYISECNDDDDYLPSASDSE